METQHKPEIFFTFRSPGGIVKRQPYRTLAQGLRQLAESEQMRPFIEEAHAQGRDVVVGVFHSMEGRPLLVVVAPAPTPPLLEAEPSVPGGRDGSVTLNIIG
jgi:hypothetical protein